MLLAKGKRVYNSIDDIQIRMEQYYLNEGYLNNSKKMERMFDQLEKLEENMRNSHNLKF